MNSLVFRGIRKPYLTVVHRKRKYWADRDLVLKGNKRNGARLRRVKTKVRIEEALVEVSTENEQDLRALSEDMAEWLLTDKEEVLIFDDEQDRKYLAIIDGSFEPEEIVTYGKGWLKFICPGSYKLGLENTLNLTSTLQPFQISGQVETPWKSRTVFSVPQSSFILESDKGRIILNYNFIAGDVLEIDYETRDVLLNGVDLATALSLETVWFDLKPGTINLKATHETVMTYTERFH